MQTDSPRSSASLFNDPNAFVVDQTTGHSHGDRFRLAHAIMGNNPNYLGLPWGEVRPVPYYYMENKPTAGMHGCVLETTLLQGEARSRALPMASEKIEQHLPFEAHGRFREMLLALLRRETRLVLPIDGRVNVSLAPTWVECVHNSDGTYRVAFYCDQVRVGTTDRNALVWRDDPGTWSLEFIQPVP